MERFANAVERIEGDYRSRTSYAEDNHAVVSGDGTSTS